MSDTHAPPNRYIVCPNCHGIIMFNAEEFLARRAAGQNTSTPCNGGWVRQGDKWVPGPEDWHPGWPPEPWLEHDGKGWSLPG